MLNALAAIAPSPRPNRSPLCQRCEARPTTKLHAQEVELMILPGDRIIEPSIALTPDLPIGLAMTNTTDEFRTFTVPALGMEGAT